MNEQELLNQLQSGNQSAFKTLVETHQKRVFNTVLAIIQNFEEAEDISQEVFMEVYQSVKKFRGESKLSTWLYRIATTKALEEIRKKKTVKRFAFFTKLFGDNNEILHQPMDFEHPGVVLEHKEKSKMLFKAINLLPDNQKVAFTLYNVEGLSYQEITEVMQLSLSSVESLLFRAKTNLRKSLSDFYKNQKI
ncbi:RNA polymerase sigma-70 factor (ECF subfamily) [Arcicella aurantiaca]|uniref:RNA polymerase sigma-70 factor (ECF subfamily) n=1 Tax=Arcicella aurantiaca TaxID=591202 RepID=A0A316ETI9_9BACT|nr:RNA polymerase sigma factor [Arcicella aurantiaca]PWK26490.1 RNA polymerase sigma-70 factor (ECF subfamily) [Arcicella aurantiaca]